MVTLQGRHRNENTIYRSSRSPGVSAEQACHKDLYHSLSQTCIERTVRVWFPLIYVVTDWKPEYNWNKMQSWHGTHSELTLVWQVGGDTARNQYSHSTIFWTTTSFWRPQQRRKPHLVLQNVFQEQHIWYTCSPASLSFVKTSVRSLWWLKYQ